jgi:hypothetical protein
MTPTNNAESLAQGKGPNPTEWTLGDVEALSGFLRDMFMERIDTFTGITRLGVSKVSIVLDEQDVCYNIEISCFPLEAESQE